MGRFIANTVDFNTLSGRTRRTVTLTVGTLNTQDGANRNNRSGRQFRSARSNVDLSDGAGRITSNQFNIAARCLMGTRRVRVGITRNTGPNRNNRLPNFGIGRIVTGAHRSVPNVDLVSPPPRRSVCDVRSLTRLVFSLGGIGPGTTVSIGLMTRDNINAVTTNITGTGTSLVIVSNTRNNANTDPTSDVHFTNVSPRVKLSRARRALIGGNLHKRIHLRMSNRLGDNHSVVLVTLLNTRRFDFNATTLVMLNYIVVHGYGLGAYPVNITARSPGLHTRFHNDCGCLVGCFHFLTRRIHRCLTRVNCASLGSVVNRARLVIHGGSRRVISARNTSTLRPRITRDVGRGTSLLSFSHLLRHRANRYSLCRAARRVRSLSGILSRRLVHNTRHTVRGRRRIGLSFTVGGASHTTNIVLDNVVTGGCNRTNLPSGAIGIGFGNSTNRDFNTFLIGKMSFGLRNRAGSCFTGKLSKNHVSVLPPVHDGFSTRSGVVTNGANLCNTADNRLCVGNGMNRHFNIHGSNTVTIVRNTNSRYYRCVANNEIMILNRANHGFTTNVDNNITCM